MKDEGATLLAFLVFPLCIGIMSWAALHYGKRLSITRIPMQWGIDGQPTWYAPQRLGLWWAVGFTSIVSGLLFAASFFASSEKVGGLALAVCLLSVTSTIAQVWHLNAVVKWADRQ